ncbi:hypothetical protein ACFE04_012461 [Oxalis oulophora]
MAALAINRKRRGVITSGDGDYISRNRNSPEFHRSKKPKSFHSSTQQRLDKAVVSSNSIVSRISRYPGTKPPSLPRPVHAPVRIVNRGFTQLKARFCSDVGEDYDRELRHLLSYDLSYGKSNSCSAFGGLRFSDRGKEIVNVETEVKTVEEIVLSDDDDSDTDMDIEEDGVVKNSEEENVVCNRSVQEPNLRNTSAALVTDGNLRVDDYAGISLEAYKKLLKDTERNDPKLKALDFEIELNEKKLTSLKLLRPVKKPTEPEIPREPFIPLTEDEKDEINRAFCSPPGKVLVSHKNSGIDITGEILRCLRPGRWLNDEVINVYLDLLKERENRDPKKFLKCHFFSTFFYSKLRSGGYKAVKRWTSNRKLGYYLIDCDKIFVPIHKQVHWCLAIINAKDKKFQYLDSLMGSDPEVLKSLAAYYVEELKDKSGKVVDVSSWEMEFLCDLPEQKNGFDCGMFMVKYADFYGRGLGLYFDQGHMPYFRLRTAKEILKLRAD